MWKAASKRRPAAPAPRAARGPAGLIIVRVPVRVAVAMLAPRVIDTPASPRLFDLDEASDAALRRAMLLDTIDAALAPGWPLHLYVTPGAEVEAMREALTADARLAAHPAVVHVHPQVDGDPSLRIGDAVARTLHAGHDVTVLGRRGCPRPAAERLARRGPGRGRESRARAAGLRPHR